MPEQKVLHNVDNQISTNINDLRHKLTYQLVMPVQWVNTMKYLSKYDGIVIECGPNKVLTGLAKANGLKNVFATSSTNFFDEISGVL